MLCAGINLMALGGCAQLTPMAQAGAGATGANYASGPGVLNLNRVTGLSQIIPELKKARAVVVGESHTYYHHHLAQLDVIKRLAAENPHLVIGLEMFQQPFQPVLDQYIAGAIDETTLLEKTEYFKRWKYDYRLYAPILRYAREHHIPLIALNIDKAITTRAGKAGIAALSNKDKARIPAEMDRHVPGYEERIHPIFDQHAGSSKHSFENFMDVQLLWDEGMAERAAGYLNQHPESTMVILAGAGHVAWRTGIPTRLQRRISGKVVTILNSDAIKLQPGVADYVMFPAEKQLPKAGMMGIFLDEKDQYVEAVGFSDDSSGKQAGIKKGDRFDHINGRKIGEIADIRLALWDKQPGDVVDVTVLRKNRPLSFRVVLK